MPLQGLKTYIVAAVGVVYALSALFTGHIDGNTAVQLLVTSLGLAGLRNAIN